MFLHDWLRRDCVLEHGVGCGWSGSHDALVKFPNYALNMLTMIVALYLGASLSFLLVIF